MNDIQERIQNHIDGLLTNAPRTKAVTDLREELLSGCYDKYADLTAAGKSPEDAYNAVIGGIGDVDELVAAITKAKSFDPQMVTENQRKRLQLVLLGVMMIVFAVAACVALEEIFHFSTLGSLVMLVGAGFGVVVIVYGNSIYKYRYEKQEDTIVEEVKQNMTAGSKQQQIRRAASSSLWALVVVLYIVISFTTHMWYITWVIFIIGAVMENLLNAYFNPAHRRSSFKGAFWCMVTVAYFIISFWSMAWHVTWVIFIIAVAIEQMIRLLSLWRD